MKIIGFSSGSVGQDANIDRMVKAVMAETGCESEFVKLNDLNYSACKSCVWLCAKPQVCMLEDDLLPYYQKVKEADAVVLGSPIHFGTINAAMISFISRFWGFRHVTIPIKNKPFVLVLTGAGLADNSEDGFRQALELYQVKVLDVIRYTSKIFPCYRCGRHQKCTIGGAYEMFGKKAHTMSITPEFFRRWEDDPQTVASVKAAGEKLGLVVSGNEKSG
ncbi:MAG: flavodoxin family protein [Planctomycetota bacterium]|jgi:multimeric flavodoxin WrbA